MTTRSLLAIFLMALFLCAGASAQTTVFTHQGQLNVSGNPATGSYDFEFRLFDAESGGAQVGSTVQRLNVTVANGIFTVSLDFGASGLTGANRFLDIGVRTAGAGAFTQLTPRQPITSAPYAVRSLNSTTADTATNATNATNANNAVNLGGVAAGQYVVTTDPRMTNDRIPLPGSANYIQNQNAAAQGSSNFNISGTGTANILSATTQYNIGGNRVLSAPGTGNVFAGFGAGQANTGSFNTFFGTNAGQANDTGSSNAFFGTGAGFLNTAGGSNAFFGSNAGDSNSTGSENAFFGRSAGLSNDTGSENAFFGRSAGQANTTGSFNAFFGTDAGKASQTGFFNAFFGWSAGLRNTTGGDRNAFFGGEAGSRNTTGSNNAFFGTNAGFFNETGNNNTMIGNGSNVSGVNLAFATAIGSNAVVTAGNQVQLGREGNDTVRIGTLAAVTANQLCINANNVLAFCSSSRRYKENINAFSGGLNLVRRLQPVTYDWIENKTADLGLIAEDVANVEPLLVTHNNKGDIQGVKYDQLTVVLINAVNQQQTQIESQQKQLKAQADEIVALKALICVNNPAEVCRKK